MAEKASMKIEEKRRLKEETNESAILRRHNGVTKDRIEEKIQLGHDDRVTLEPMTSPPYNWICAITYRSPSDPSKYDYGTGFKINFPHVKYSVVVTAAHVIWDEYKKAKPENITLKFPDKPSFEVPKNNLYKPEEFRSSRDENYDYGLIFYENGNNHSDGFGWSTQISDHELQKRIITVCGFPLDAFQFAPQIEDLKMLITGGEITKVHKYRLEYLNDTMGGQSGCPLYTWYQGYWTVVGIHTTGAGKCNSGRRLDLEVIARFARAMDCQKALQSVQNPNAHLSCRPSASMSSWGEVNCQYIQAGNFEKFYIYPVAMPPSIAKAQPDILPKFVIESVHHKNWLLSLYFHWFSYKMYTHWLSNYMAGKRELFYLKKENGNDGVYSFICVVNPHYRIRVDATYTGSGEPLNSGSGTSNVQYYETPREKPTKDNPYTQILESSYESANLPEKIKIISF